MPRWVAALFLTIAAASCTSNSATLTSPTPTKCQVSLALESSTIAASGGNGHLDVTTTPECTWTATTEAAWISGLAPASGQGSAQIDFSVAANSLPSARDGDVVVNDQRAHLRQEAAACEITVAPETLDVAADGGSQSVAVNTLSGCAWTASSEAGWITVSPATGSGTGTLRLDIAANNGAARVGTVRVGERVVTVQQRSGSSTNPTCNYGITPRGQTLGADGGAGGPIAVSAAPGCTWTAQSNVPWITITGGQSGSGAGAVTFNVQAHSGAARTGTLTVAGETFVVTQNGVQTCSYGVSPLTQGVGPAGGVQPPIQVTTAANCAWTATSGVSWITVRSGASGSGNGTVTYEVAANSGGARSGAVTIAGQAVTVNQEAASCSYAISPSRQTIGPAGGPGTPIALTAGPACAWTAESSVPWITITSPRAGSGPTTVTYTVASNTGDARRGVITIGGQTFTVDQEGQTAPACTYDVDPTSHSAPVTGGNATVSVNAPVGCMWTAISNHSWIVVASGSSGSGSGSVTFVVGPNLIGERTGTLTIAGETLTVNQAALLPTPGNGNTGNGRASIVAIAGHGFGVTQ